jgi:phosphoribosylformylglycinamidine synthase
MPIAHGEGCYIADPETVARLEREGRVVFRYVPAGAKDPTDGNPNGSVHAIAGIVNEAGNVLGMMPHPERACDPLITSTDGAGVLLSVAKHVMGAADRHMSPFAAAMQESVRAS